MFPALTPLWCMEHRRRSTPIHRSFIPRLGITWQVRPSPSVWELPWVRCGAEAGVGAAAGEETTTSPLTTTTTSTATRTEPPTWGAATELPPATELPLGTEVARGSTIPSIEAVLRTEIGRPQTDLVVLLAAIP